MEKISKADRIAHFWSYVDIRDPDECWPWLGAINDDGYGKYKYHGKSIGAHVTAYKINNNISLDVELDITIKIRHSCDHRKCCNFAHLLAGTQLDNVRDAVSRNRHIHGETSGRSKLTEDQVINIIKAYRTGKFKQAKLAQIYGVEPFTISSIITGRTWKYLNRNTL